MIHVNMNIKILITFNILKLKFQKTYKNILTSQINWNNFINIEIVVWCISKLSEK